MRWRCGCSCSTCGITSATWSGTCGREHVHRAWAACSFTWGGSPCPVIGPSTRRQRLYQAEAALVPSSRSPLPEGEISAPREPLPGSGSEPRLSVVIPTWNRRRDLERTLAALRAHEAPPFEVIVVDNASEDGTAEWVSVKHPQVRLVRLPENLGPTGARNAGVAVARGEYIVLLEQRHRTTSGHAGRDRAPVRWGSAAGGGERPPDRPQDPASLVAGTPRLFLRKVAGARVRHCLQDRGGSLRYPPQRLPASGLLRRALLHVGGRTRPARPRGQVGLPNPLLPGGPLPPLSGIEPAADQRRLPPVPGASTTSSGTRSGTPGATSPSGTRC